MQTLIHICWHMSPCRVTLLQRLHSGFGGGWLRGGGCCVFTQNIISSTSALSCEVYLLVPLDRTELTSVLFYYTSSYHLPIRVTFGENECRCCKNVFVREAECQLVRSRIISLSTLLSLPPPSPPPYPGCLYVYCYMAGSISSARPHSYLSSRS